MTRSVSFSPRIVQNLQLSRLTGREHHSLRGRSFPLLFLRFLNLPKLLFFLPFITNNKNLTLFAKGGPENPYTTIETKFLCAISFFFRLATAITTPPLIKLRYYIFIENKKTRKGKEGGNLCKEVSFQHESTRGMRLPHSPATSRAFRNPDEAGAPPTNTENASE